MTIRVLNRSRIICHNLVWHFGQVPVQANALHLDALAFEKTVFHSLSSPRQCQRQTYIQRAEQLVL
jgi:hypothetical protein